MFERYTERARRVIFFARYETSEVGSTAIQTEHLLLGLLREDARLLTHFLGPSAPQLIRDAVAARLTRQEKIPEHVDLPLSNECRRILAYAAEESERLAQPQSMQRIGVEHLLLGIMREERCTAAQILADHGLQLERVREQLARLPVLVDVGSPQLWPRVIDGKHLTLKDALAKIPGSEGQRFAELFSYASLSVEIYAPRGTDPQTPHTRDEAYIVVAGSGEFVFGDQRVTFTAGDFLFAPAGAVHRFENFTDDLVVWVIFYGPEGGETP